LFSSPAQETPLPLLAPFTLPPSPRRKIQHFQAPVRVASFYTPPCVPKGFCPRRISYTAACSYPFPGSPRFFSRYPCRTLCPSPGDDGLPFLSGVISLRRAEPPSVLPVGGHHPRTSETTILCAPSFLQCRGSLFPAEDSTRIGDLVHVAPFF